MTDKKPKFYAVKVGRQTGIFTTWDECLAATHGYSGAVYKKFASYQEALEWLNSSAIEQPIKQSFKRSESGPSASETATNILSASPTIDFSADYDVYTDGSFGDGRYAWAYVFVKDGEIVYEDSGVGKNPEAAVMRNVAGEIAAVLYAVRQAARMGAKVRIHHDYAGIAHWVRGEWKANSEFTQLYVQLMRRYEGFYDFVKVTAHSGNQFNEYVDKLAKKALATGGNEE